MDQATVAVLGHVDMASVSDKNAPMASKPSVSITYCQVCGFRSRAAWLAQELLAANEENLAGITLVPARGGIFEVRINDVLVFSHEQDGRFPEPRELKDAVRAALGQEAAPRHD